ncbi:hypothetical protein LOTGIDRAFT_238952 [Lottia gigantea]|uniref:Thioredoxin domain-containing protein n=1 Tax=Lottia gigantea TaxID=225164 RepID=V4A538_LOTGI|nr:hypothetical protein LOTGIDRAFT_238952 [Lottia gigantea]ESO99023.1 hypothetical protein LOTGIDRAFT_238952 [Lottia gigantea]
MAEYLETVKESAEFSKLLNDFKSQLIVVHFAANWAPQCKQINDVLTELSKNTKNTKIVQLEAENVPEISQKYEIVAVPTVVFFKNGEKVDRLDGANVAELSKKVSKWSSGSQVVTSEPPKQDLNTRLKNLINQANVMLFMKGSPREPKCGFSRQIIQILNDNQIEFGYFDILTDDDVRQGLKKYSDWPTYPQLYHNGELLGGLDIIKELVESNELCSTLGVQDKPSLNERLKSIINLAPVMIFMKGNPETPKCGFSRTLVDLLNSESIKYKTFDILSDEEVRQGLKKYSDWPTYPQVYVKGDLIGGLDIIKELKEGGELQSTFNPE